VRGPAGFAPDGENFVWEVAASASERIRLVVHSLALAATQQEPFPTSRISLFMVSRRKTEPPRDVRRPELPEPDRRRTLRRRTWLVRAGVRTATSSGHSPRRSPNRPPFPTPAAGSLRSENSDRGWQSRGGLNRPVTGSPPDPPRQRNARAGHRVCHEPQRCRGAAGRNEAGQPGQADGILQPIEFGLDASAERRAALRAAQLRRRMRRRRQQPENRHQRDRDKTYGHHHLDQGKRTALHLWSREGRRSNLEWLRAPASGPGESEKTRNREIGGDSAPPSKSWQFSDSL